MTPLNTCPVCGNTTLELIEQSPETVQYYTPQAGWRVRETGHRINKIYCSHCHYTDVARPGNKQHHDLENYYRWYRSS